MRSRTPTIIAPTDQEQPAENVEALDGDSSIAPPSSYAQPECDPHNLNLPEKFFQDLVAKRSPRGSKRSSTMKVASFQKRTSTIKVLNFKKNKPK